MTATPIRDDCGHYAHIVGKRDRVAAAMKRRGASLQGIARLHGRVEYPLPLCSPPAVVVPIVKNPPKPAASVNLSDEMKAEIAAYAFKAVNAVLSDHRKRMALAAIPLNPVDRPSVREVMGIVALHAEIRTEDLISDRRARNIAWPRQIAMALAKETQPRLSLPAIGRAFGGKDHTTVMHALRRAAEHIEDDDTMAQLYRRSRATIESKWPEAFA